jgi:predicted ATPase/class 3 adenylate cyclase
MDLPGGTLTFLFTDIEGSTRLWEREPEVMQATVARHDALLAEIVSQYAGSVVKTTGDGMLAVFVSAPEAAQAALAIQRALRDEAWDAAIGQLRVRAALHTGTAQLRGGDYFGTAVNRTARLLSAGHGGQTLLSLSAQEHLQDHLPDKADSRFLGEYRLRDLTRPERVYQLIVPDLPADFPPLRTRSLRPSNLPAELSSFVGREQEITEVKRLLESARLVTLTGPGGAGKTRLSQHVAASAAWKYADGICFVALGATSHPELVPNTIAKALGVIEQPNRPLVDLLERYLSNKEMLLVLDNYEHVLEAATLVAELLAAAPELCALVTSREVLRLNGEYKYRIPPLTTPDPSSAASPAELSTNESVALFVQRAQAASPNFRLTEENARAVASICARLDGLPLAIELAAARIKLFSPAQILERLENRLGLLTHGSRDLPARQRTLRNTIDWSYNLLDGDERRLFARMGVFTGGRSLEAVETVCAPGLGIDALDGLESLINKSLLHQEEGPGGEPRFTMLETIHEYARERLSQSGEEQEVRVRHLNFFLSLAEAMEPGYRRSGQLLLLDRTEAELGNLRAAFEWAMEMEQVEAAARMISAVDYFLYYRDRFVEGYRWFKLVLDMRAAIPLEHQTRFLLAAGRLAWVNTEVSQSRKLYRKVLLLALDLKDRCNQGWSLINLAATSIGQLEEYAAAIELCQEGVAIFRELDGKPGIAQGLNILGELARAAGDYTTAGQVYEECMAVCQETGETFRETMTLSNLAFVATHEEDYARARNLLLSAIKRWREIGSLYGITTDLAFIAGPLARLGEPEKAARLLSASDALLAGMGFVPNQGDQHEIANYAADVRAQLDESTFEAAWAEGQAMTLDAAIAYALEGDQTVN